ncbi:MAG: hypothetical protein ABSE99_07200 [Terracidiphilus sp.]|jgi:hypothetical protein
MITHDNRHFVGDFAIAHLRDNRVMAQAKLLNLPRRGRVKKARDRRLA